MAGPQTHAATQGDGTIGGRSVGVIGLGNMGGRIAQRLVDAGHAVVGHDLDAEKARSTGLPLAPSAAAVAAQADRILLSLPDSTAVEAVMLDSDGVLSAARAGHVVVDCSTSRPKSTVTLHAECARHEVEFVDAGISGGPAAAEQGTLTLMVGGSQGTVRALEPIFAAFAGKVAHMGPPGTGHTAKVLNNFLNGISLSATAEVMVAARKAGLDLATFLDVLNASSGINFATLNRFPEIIEGNYLEGGLSGHLMMKDLVLYVEHLKDLGVPPLNAASCLAAFGVSHHLGYGPQVSNRVVDALGDIAGGVRLHTTDEAGQAPESSARPREDRS